MHLLIVATSAGRSLTPDSAAVHGRRVARLFGDGRQPEVVVRRPAENLALYLHRFGGPIDPGATHFSFDIEASQREVVVRMPRAPTESVFFARSSDGVRISTTESLLHADPEAEEDEEAVEWFLRNGHLGPRPGLLRGTERVPPGADVRFRLTSPITVSVHERSWEARWPTRKRVAREVRQAVDSMGDAPLLSLSGGFDSRLLLKLLADRRPSIVSYGVPDELVDSRSDHAIARALASEHGLPFISQPGAPRGDPVQVFENFCALSEGHTDQISGYLDGGAGWADLARDGFATVIRGDEAFGWLAVGGHADARASVGLVPTELGRGPSGPPALPAELAPTRWETAASYRDRLYRRFRIPQVLGPLSKIKAHFLRVLNPFLTDALVDGFGSLPDPLRTDKRWIRWLHPEIRPRTVRPRGPEPVERLVYELRSQLGDRLTTGPRAEALSLGAAESLAQLLDRRPISRSNRPGGRFPVPFRPQLRELARRFGVVSSPKVPPWRLALRIAILIECRRIRLRQNVQP